MEQLEPFVYYGTSEFSRIVLQGLLQAQARPSLVVSTAAKPAGRGLRTLPTPVARAAAEAKLPLLEVVSLRSPQVQTQLSAAATKFAVLAAFGKIVPPAVLALYPRGIVNVHPSLLPKYRGPAPMQYAIRDGATETGVSLIVLDDEVDHGPVLAQQPEPIHPSDDATTLAERLAPLAVTMLLEALPRYLRGELQPREQQHALASFTKMVSRDDGQADFSKSAPELDQQRRAFTPWPGLWCTYGGKRLKILDSSAFQVAGIQPGAVATRDGEVLVGCAQGALQLKRVQLEGGKPLGINDFVRGHAEFVGSSLQ